MIISMFAIIVFSFRYTFLAAQQSNYIFEPSFVSNWYVAKAQDPNVSPLTIYHYLGEYPVKVDVQIKINDGGNDYIFTGLGSAQRDDDFSEEYGGVIYVYNQEHVNITFPFQNNDFSSGRLGYTGSSLYSGPTLQGPYYNGFVRIRVWLASDIPQAVFRFSVYLDNIQNYMQVDHNLGKYPDLVTVQTLLPDGYMSDGVGVVFMANTTDYWNTLTGVLYGYDASKVRLWVPSAFAEYTGTAGGVFGASDGYSLGYEVGGIVHITAWHIDSLQQVLCKTFTVGNGVPHDSSIEFPRTYDLTNYLVSVQYKIPDAESPNGGMVFSGAGTTQALSSSNYGGVIYVYSENRVMLWVPNNGHVVYIGERWGGGVSSQISNSAEVIIGVFHLQYSECPYPEIIGNATFHVSGVKFNDNVTYVCDAGYINIGGNPIRFCESNRRWSGVSPFCAECPSPEIIGNATFHVSGVKCNDNVTYVCDAGYINIGGNPIRFCESNRRWSGVIPFCAVACNQYHVNQTMKNTESIDIILSRIRVNKKNTSASLRKLSSAYDDRTSSLIIGTIAVSILVIVVCFFILPDLITVCKHLCSYQLVFKR